MKHEKLKLSEVARRLDEVHASLKKDAQVALTIFVPVFVVCAVSCFLLPPLGIIGGVIAGLVYGVKHAKRKRALEKVEFVRELHRQLEDELQPRRPVLLDFDLRHYDEASKLVWEGRSSAGNRKHKYSDKWLHYRATLADGTCFRVVRQAGVKTKKGSVVKEKRRLFMEVSPDPRRYDLSQLRDERPRHRLRARLDAATGAFHDEPEEFHARVEAAQGVLKLKVTQEDAPIHPQEVVTILEEVVRFLQELRPGAGGGPPEKGRDVERGRDGVKG